MSGRIYRLTYKGNDQRNKLSLSKSNTKGLLEALRNDNMFWRITAQRLLVEKADKSVLPELYRLAQNEELDEIGINAAVVHALWTMHGLKALDGTNKEALAVATKALTHPAGGVRKAAIEVLPKNLTSFQALVKARSFEDKDMRVRLAAVLATTDMKPAAEIGNVLVSVAEKEENISDLWLRHALTVASKLNETHFRAAFRKRGLNDNPSLTEATIAQRLAFGSRLNAIPLRRTFGRQQGEPVMPELMNREFLLSGDLERSTRGGPNAAQNTGTTPPPLSGVVATQGNKENGYSLYVLQNKLHFQVNQNGRSYKIESTKELPAKFSFKAGMNKDGTMRLLIDNKEAGTAKASGLFKKEMTVPLRVGLDNRKADDRVVEYPDTLFLLRANLTNAKLETLEGLNATATTTAKTVKIDQTIVLKVLKDVMKYDKQTLTAKAGTTIQIVLQNPDFMQHNLVLIKPNTLEKVGAAADKLAQDPNGAKMNYIPKMPEVIAATPLINPAGKYTLTIKLPDTPGDYPYVCTFPAHWRIMKGILRVTK
jgi:azurin